MSHITDYIAGWFQDGGIFMWVILSVLAVACAVVIERVIFYYLICRTNGNRLVADIARAINEGNIKNARERLGGRKAPMDLLLGTAITRYEAGMSMDEIQEGVEECAIKQIPRLSQRLNYLSLFANVATLLGLLGTISGLRVSFSSLASVEAARKATMLADGISQAMLTTAFGLVVAVPCMIFYTFLVNKQNRLTKDVDEAVVRLLNFLKKKSTR
jgi:biopolymer transport protein ExbB